MDVFILLQAVVTLLMTSGLSQVGTVGGFTKTDMSSWTDQNTGDLARDGDASTCAVTGLDIGPWWVLDLGHPRVVTRVGIQGYADPFQVRVGNDTESLGHRGGFADNKICVFRLGIRADDMKYFECKRPRHGRYLSIHVVDPASYYSMKLCEINVEYV